MTAASRARWGVAAVVLLVIGALAIGVGSGVCVDYVAIPGECTVEPALGWPGAILVAGVCGALAVLCFRRAVRRRASASRGEDADPRGQR
ncbi:Na+/melibiose symporter-like transporter [Clavibacter michiganensis]|nr:Na+/melibiose symporter-like transporter [Clavibacter michiganensis]